MDEYSWTEDASAVDFGELSELLDCAYIADVAVHPEHQGRGLGQAIIGGW